MNLAMMFRDAVTWSRRGGVLLALVALMALAGCATASPTPEVTLEPAKTAKPTFTLVPTSTLAPTMTPLPSVTPTPVATATHLVTPTPTQDAAINPLTGQRVEDPATLKRRVLAVRIGNDATIRPQEGLGQADIVYEEIMDGWTLTRFTALYLARPVERIRPVRSARLSSLAIAPQYDAVLVHSGASDRIRWMISQADFADLDQYFHDEPYGVLTQYDWRGRMYTSVPALRDYLQKKGLERDTAIEPLLFDATPPQGHPANAVNIPYPQLCVVDWAYDAAQGRYLRSVQGKPHLEGLTQEQITAQNVVVLYAEHKKTDIVEDSLGSTAIDIVLDGSGRVQVIRDGVVIEGRWERQAQDRPIRYLAEQGGVPIPLKPGQTWIQLVPPDYTVVVTAQVGLKQVSLAS